MRVGSVGSIDNAKLANDLLEKDGLDIVTVGRGFQKNPGLGKQRQQLAGRVLLIRS